MSGSRLVKEEVRMSKKEEIVGRKLNTVSKNYFGFFDFVELNPDDCSENKLYPTDEKLYSPEMEKVAEEIYSSYFGFFDKDNNNANTKKI